MTDPSGPLAPDPACLPDPSPCLIRINHADNNTLAYMWSLFKEAPARYSVDHPKSNLRQPDGTPFLAETSEPS